MTCGASRDDRFLESKNRSANHSVLHPCAALSPLVARAPTIPDAMQGRKRFGLASCTRTRLQQRRRIFPLSQCGWAPRDLDLACPPSDARARKKRHMWPWQTSIHVDAWRKAEPSQDIVTGAKEQRSNTAPVQTHNRRRCSSTWRRSPGSCTACVSKSQYSILNTQYSVLGTFEGPTSRLCWDLRPSSRTQQPCG